MQKFWSFLIINHEIHEDTTSRKDQLMIARVQHRNHCFINCNHQHTTVQVLLHQTQLMIARVQHRNHCFINCNHQHTTVQVLLHQTQLMIARVQHRNHCFINCNHQHTTVQVLLHQMELTAWGTTHMHIVCCIRTSQVLVFETELKRGD